MISTLLFTWLQGANFYFDLHKQAVESLPVGNGELWLDIGCGPGLVTRFAAERKYRAIGLDTDPQMIAAAKRIARRTHSSAEFQTGDFTTLPAESAKWSLPPPCWRFCLTVKRVCVPCGVCYAQAGLCSSSSRPIK